MPRYLIRLPDPALARGPEPSLSFTANGADAFAEQLQAALATPVLFERWRALQAEPDEVDPAMGATDPSASVSGTQKHLHVDLVADTRIPGELLSQRLRWLAGQHWELRDVRF